MRTKHWYALPPSGAFLLLFLGLVCSMGKFAPFFMGISCVVLKHAVLFSLNLNVAYVIFNNTLCRMLVRIKMVYNKYNTEVDTV